MGTEKTYWLNLRADMISGSFQAAASPSETARKAGDRARQLLESDTISAQRRIFRTGCFACFVRHKTFAILFFPRDGLEREIGKDEASLTATFSEKRLDALNKYKTNSAILFLFL